MGDEVEKIEVMTNTRKISQDDHHDDQSTSTTSNSSSNHDNRKNCPVFTRLIKTAKRSFSLVDLEPMMLFHGIVHQLTTIMINDFLFHQACVVNQNLTVEYCTRNKTMDNGVAEVVADIKVWREVIESVLSAGIFLFIGSWTDLFGRKLPILLGMSGFLIQILGVFLCLWFPGREATAEVTGIVTIVPIALTAGTTSVTLGVFSFAADQTSDKDRTLKMGLSANALIVGISIGAGLTSILKSRGVGHMAIFSVAGVMELSAVIYVLIFMKSSGKLLSQELEGESERSKPKWTSLFSLKHVTRTEKVLFRSREGHARFHLILFFSIILLASIPLSGERVVLQQFAYKRFQWTTSEFAFFNTIQRLINSIGGFFLLAFFIRVLKLEDSTVGIVSAMSQIGGSLIYAFADQTWMMYLGATVDLLDGAMQTTARSCISKIVGRDELGKLLSFSFVARDLLPVVMDPAYAAIFRWNMNSFPGAFYLVSTAAALPIFFIYLYFYVNVFHDKKIEENFSSGENELSQNQVQDQDFSPEAEAMKMEQ